jgi:hypothetical protein
MEVKRLMAIVKKFKEKGTFCMNAGNSSGKDCLWLMTLPVSPKQSTPTALRAESIQADSRPFDLYLSSQPFTSLIVG